MAQAAAILAFRTLGSKPDEMTTYFYAGIDNARFRKPVEPGDQLRIEITLQGSKRGVWKFGCAVRVGDTLVSEADIMCATGRLAGAGR
jgi:3-hydroxyacyl-[acyl-carrier-protein] dehydratase